MPEYLAPGVYVEEIERGPKPIQGVATSTAAFLGATERGPQRPWLITGNSEYLRLFGEEFGEGGNYMPAAVKAFFDNGGRRLYVARIVGQNASKSDASFNGFTVRAIGPGVSGDRIWVRIEAGSTRVNDVPLGFRVRVYYWSAGSTPFDFAADPDNKDRPLLIEDFDDLRIEQSSPSYHGRRIGSGKDISGNSALIELEVADGTAPPDADTVLGGPLEGGTDGDPLVPDDFNGNDDDPDRRTGLAALDLDAFREVAIVYAPAVDTLTIVPEIIRHCEQNHFRFAVIDAPSDQGVVTNLDPRSTITDTQYAAFYYPWIYIADPRSGARRKVPPGGAVCGIYALTDTTRGVFKAPANETVAGAIDLEYDINQRAQEVLNPRGVNVIRRFPGRGIRVWGARTLSSDPLWKYVSVRRLFIFLEASIYNATQWVVFEPNDQRLWARVKQTVTLFLRTQWREGALFGAKEDEAFSVAVGRETMTEDQILNGLLIVEIGIAPVRPAEFVVFRVFQKTQEAK